MQRGSTNLSTFRDYEECFIVAGGEVRLATEGILAELPCLAIRAFFIAQQLKVRLHPRLLGEIRDQVPKLLRQQFRSNPLVLGYFRELLRTCGRVGPVLRPMHETGLLGVLVPSFERQRGRVQHEHFHLYPVDEHTLVCLEKLDAIWNEQLPHSELYKELFRQIPRPELLYLALLLHDVGKGEGGNHAESGARIAAVEARRLGFAPAEAERVTFLVRHHLTMVMVSQKRDLDDPEVVRRFAELVGDTENLRMLTLLTLADSLGTSQTLWNGFKDTLLRTLFSRALQYLTGTVVPTATARREELYNLIRKVPPPGIAPDEIEAHFAGLPENYFQHLTLEDLVADLNTIHAFLALHAAGRAPPLTPAIRAQDYPHHSCSLIRVCTWDHSGLFARLAAALSAANLNIMSAEIYTRSDHLVLDRFYVAEPGTNAPARDSALTAFCTLTEKALAGELSLVELLQQAREGHSLSPGRAPAPPRITFDNQACARRTVLEIQAPDRLGLLAVLAVTLAELGVDISLAKIHTVHGMADDAFYVTESDGQPILSPVRQETIRARLTAALAESF